MFNNFLASTGSEGKKELWRTAEIWHCKKPGKATTKDVDSIAMEATRLKASWREVEACHYVVGSESLKRVQKRLLVKMWPGYRGNPNMSEIPLQRSSFETAILSL